MSPTILLTAANGRTGRANGVFGSRRIERATYRDLGARYITADTHPDHDTICKFRRENFEAVAESFLQVLLLARELKLLRVGLVSVDGTKVRANASKRRSVRYDRAKALSAQLEADIAELMTKAGQADAQDLSADIVPGAVGDPKTVLADNGFANGREVAALEPGAVRGRRMEVLVAVGTEDRRRRCASRPMNRFNHCHGTAGDALREGPSPTDC